MEVKIIDPTNQTDIDFIKNNPQFKQDFEDLASWYRENKKKSFEEILNPPAEWGIVSFIFGVGILNSRIVSYAMGYQNSYGLGISGVYSSVRNIGGCKNVVEKIFDHYWDKEKLQFINDLSFSFNVVQDNIPAIKCYTKFGCISDPNWSGLTKNEEGIKVPAYRMILTKELYAEKYLLPEAERKLAARQKYI